MAIRKTSRTGTVKKPLIGRTTAISLGAAALAVGGALLAVLARGRTFEASAEHAAPDLALDEPHPGPEHRAPVDFRPDPTAPVSAAERESLRPAAWPEDVTVAQPTSH